jgi:uncharacterized protein (DUF169 family)
MIQEDIVKRNQEMAGQYKGFLCPEGNLVAVKMLTNLEGWEKFKRPPKSRTLCQMISQTRYIGRTFLAKADDFSCYAVPALLFGEEMPKGAAKRYVGWQFGTEEAAQKSFDALPAFERNKYVAIFLTPLEKCHVEPDTVIIFGNASQMLVLYSAYLRNRGGDFAISVGNNGACARVTVAPIRDNIPKLAIPGNAWKLLALPSNTDLIFSIPGGLLGEIAENAWKLRNTGGSRYPAAWQHIDWDIQAPIGDLLKKEGGGPSWLKK